MTGSTHKPIKEIIGETIGEASMCWVERDGERIFDSERAAALCERVSTMLERRAWVESLIKGHMEAMRPLLDEWAGKE